MIVYKMCNICYVENLRRAENRTDCSRLPFPSLKTTGNMSAGLYWDQNIISTTSPSVQRIEAVMKTTEYYQFYQCLDQILLRVKTLRHSELICAGPSVTLGLRLDQGKLKALCHTWAEAGTR